MRFTFILFLTNVILFDRSRGSGTVSVWLSYYNNAEGLENQGYCCDGTTVICNSGNRCDHYFIVCLDRSRESNNNINQCEIGRYTTGTTNGKNVISFVKSIGGIPNPKKLRFQKWLDTVVVKVEVWDDDINPDDFVDRFATSVNINANNFGAKMTDHSFKVKARTQLDFKMAVFCDENWYGPRCDIHCIPSLGNYRCAADGSKVCASGATCENLAHEETGSPESQTGHGAKSDVTSCNSAISINCGTNMIIIVKVNTTSNLAPRLLEQCNAQNKCQVPNNKRECVMINHCCWTNQLTLELNESSTQKVSTSSKLRLMSQDYDRGQYQRAENVNCTIQMAGHDKIANKSMHLVIYEFAPFITSSDFCLSVANSALPPFCSGSGKLYSTYGPFTNGTDEWQFDISFRNTSAEVPMIRYLMDIVVISSEDETNRFELKCHSQPASTTDNNWILRSAMKGTVLSLLIMIIFVIICLTSFCLCRSKGHPEEVSEIFDHVYYEVDSSAVREGQSTSPAIPTENINESSRGSDNRRSGEGRRFGEGHLPGGNDDDDDDDDGYLVPRQQIMEQRQAPHHQERSGTCRRETPQDVDENGYLILL